MSHIARVKSIFNDKDILKRAAQAIPGVRVEDNVTRRVYSQTHHGLAIFLPGWTFPVMVTEGGDAIYDNSLGSWGDQRHFDVLKRNYVASRAAAQLRSEGHRVTEHEQEDGSIEVLAEVDA